MDNITSKDLKCANVGMRGKTAKVLAHLQAKGSISIWEAIDLYGATRLSAIIFNLRKRYDITSVFHEFTDRFDNTSKYVTYVYHGELEHKPLSCKDFSSEITEDE
jgi:hypothetical protein